MVSGGIPTRKTVVKLKQDPDFCIEVLGVAHKHQRRECPRIPTNTPRIPTSGHTHIHLLTRARSSYPLPTRVCIALAFALQPRGRAGERSVRRALCRSVCRSVGPPARRPVGRAIRRPHPSVAPSMSMYIRRFVRPSVGRTLRPSARPSIRCSAVGLAGRSVVIADGAGGTL